MASSRESKRNEHFESLRGKNPLIAYLLNIILPGLGNCFYGRPVMGVLLMIIVSLAALLFFAGGLAALIGVIIIIVSIIGAFFTFGLSLILLPLGVLMLLLGAGPLLSFLMYAFCLVVAEILVARTADRIRALEENDQFRTRQSYSFQDTNDIERYLTAQSAKASRGWLTAKILLGVLLFVGAAIIGGSIVYFRPPIVQPLFKLIGGNGQFEVGSSRLARSPESQAPIERAKQWAELGERENARNAPEATAAKVKSGLPPRQSQGNSQTGLLLPAREFAQLESYEAGYSERLSQFRRCTEWITAVTTAFVPESLARAPFKFDDDGRPIAIRSFTVMEELLPNFYGNVPNRWGFGPFVGGVFWSSYDYKSRDPLRVLEGAIDARQDDAGGINSDGSNSVVGRYCRYSFGKYASGRSSGDDWMEKLTQVLHKRDFYTDPRFQERVGLRPEDVKELWPFDEISVYAQAYVDRNTYINGVINSAGSDIRDACKSRWQEQVVKCTSYYKDAVDAYRATGSRQ